MKVKYLEEKIYYENKKYEIIYDDHDIMKISRIQCKINYKKNAVDIVCECGAPLKNKRCYNKHITTDKHIRNMKIKYGNLMWKLINK